jgi:hypothetical protein
VILRNIFAQRVVSPDDVFGAMCGYLLAGKAWFNIFLLIETFLPGSFSVSPDFVGGLDSWSGRIAVLSNVSLASLTSVGSTAAWAVRPPATVLIPLEALFGQFYIAVVVAQLVGEGLHSIHSGNLSLLHAARRLDGWTRLTDTSAEMILARPQMRAISLAAQR